MQRLRFECTYCGNVWIEKIYHNSKSLTFKPTCDTCGDRNIKIKDIASTHINYYEGSPDFDQLDPDWYPTSDDYND